MLEASVRHEISSTCMCVINPTRELDVYVLFGVAEHVGIDSHICAYNVHSIVLYRQVTIFESSFEVHTKLL
jgi:hypothetical protein